MQGSLTYSGGLHNEPLSDLVLVLQAQDNALDAGVASEDSGGVHGNHSGY